MRRGLVFGKFMPLHRGHQLLIEAAFAECDNVTILVYDSPVGDDTLERMPVAKRLGWIADLYPQAEQIVSVADPWFDKPGHDGPEYAERYARELDFLGRFDRVFTSEPAYDSFVAALGAEQRVMDESRLLVPISGTAIRADLYGHRGWMDPIVYASLIQKVVLVGTESTGKTTLARELAHVYDTLWTHEFGREFWVEHGAARSPITSSSRKPSSDASMRRPGTRGTSCSATRMRGRRCTGRCSSMEQRTCGSGGWRRRRWTTTSGCSAGWTSRSTTTASGSWAVRRPLVCRISRSPTCAAVVSSSSRRPAA